MDERLDEPEDRPLSPQSRRWMVRATLHAAVAAIATVATPKQGWAPPPSNCNPFNCNPGQCNPVTCPPVVGCPPVAGCPPSQP